MSIDLSQFHQVFFEESFEGLEIMENGLLDLAPGSNDTDAINTIFRAAHSIKGGAGTFGFQMVSDFTHVAETLLDEYRSESRAVTQNGIDLLLESVDVLRNILGDLQAKTDVNMSDADALKVRFEAFLAGSDQPVQGDVTPTTKAAPEIASQTEAPAADGDSSSTDTGLWRIKFIPSADIVQTGNEPFRIFREIKELGELKAIASLENIPTFSTLDPEQLYIHWQLDLISDCDKSEISEVFEWVIDDSVVEIERIESAAEVEESVTSAPESAVREPIESDIENDTTSVAPAMKPIANEAVDDKASDQAKVTRPASGESQSIRVGIDKIDSLINMVGELVITQSMLGQIGNDFSVDKLQRLQEGLIQLEQNTREMQESVMRIRMVPISFTFNRFPRLVRDISKKLDKKIRLELKGENTELDKTVMEKIGDPLVHMIRNSMDHGIETPEVRSEKGKNPEGVLTLNAYHQGGYIVIEISDDGNGIDPQIIRKKAIENGLISKDEHLSDQHLQELIFHPGLSTAEAVSDLSGRGVGMDVVKRNIQELKGTVELDSTLGEGSTFRIKLPLTLSILDGQLIKLGTETYVLPLSNIIESIEVSSEQLNSVAGETDVIVLRDEYVPVVRLYEVFNIEPINKSIFDGLVVVVESGSQKIGLHVDDLLAQQQVVIKSLDTNYKRVEGLSGATILGDGTVALIVDIAGLMDIVGEGLNLSSAMVKSA